MSTAVLVVGSAVLLVPCYLRLGLLHPATVTVALWVVLSLLAAAQPFNLVVPNLEVGVAIVSGLAALCLLPLVLGKPRLSPGDRVTAGKDPAAVRTAVRLWPFTLAALALLAFVTWGVLEFQSAVSAALGGQSFDEVDAKLVRWAQLFGDVKLSGPASAALALAPLLGALAVVGGLCHAWWWYLLLPASLYLTMQSPSRTATFSLAVTSLFFFLMMSRAPGVRPQHGRAGRAGRGRTLLLLAVVAVLGLVYFAYVGQQLEKQSGPRGLVAADWVPEGLVQPLMYQLGGLSAFSVILDEPMARSGPYGAFGRSIYGAVKVAQLLGLQFGTPQPFAKYVDIPVPFNTYTAFGDTYFDLGLAGVVVVFFLTGLVLHVFSVWPRPGHAGSLWVLSVMTSALTATPLHMRVLDGDVLLTAVLGFLLLKYVLRAKRTPAPVARVDALVGARGE